jgi:nucleotidyltransferase-like protein
MKADAAAQFQQIVQHTRADPHVVGVLLGGSRGKGFENESSDYDICVVVADDTPAQVRDQYEQLNSETIDIWTYSLSEIRAATAWGGPEHGDRYSYTHLTAVIDKLDGEFQRLVNAIGTIPEEQRISHIRGTLDGYINSVYRSMKCLRRRDMLGARLEAQVSIGFLLAVLFGREGRHQPFYSYLERELRKYPLTSIPLTADELLAKLAAISETAELTTQQELLAMVDTLLRPDGYSHVFDDWGAKYSWMQTFKG